MREKAEEMRRPVVLSYRVATPRRRWSRRCRYAARWSWHTAGTYARRQSSRRKARASWRSATYSRRVRSSSRRSLMNWIVNRSTSRSTVSASGLTGLGNGISQPPSTSKVDTTENHCNDHPPVNKRSFVYWKGRNDARLYPASGDWWTYHHAVARKRGRGETNTGAAHPLCPKP